MCRQKNKNKLNFYKYHMVIMLTRCCILQPTRLLGNEGVRYVINCYNVCVMLCHDVVKYYTLHRGELMALRRESFYPLRGSNVSFCYAYPKNLQSIISSLSYKFLQWVDTYVQMFCQLLRKVLKLT